MGKFKNLSNLSYGKLKVTNNYKIENKKTYWLCNCSCGGQKWIRADHLVSKKVVACGLCEGNECIGKKFGKLTVIKRLPKEENQRQYKFLCRCECGEYHTSTLGHLKDGHVSCCKKCNRVFEKHEHHRVLYKRWHDMISRCEKENTKSYHNYGGRGIKVCEEWRTNYMSFREWSLDNGFEKGLELDRIDVNGDYKPENCRWITHKENANNKRNTIRIEGIPLVEISNTYNLDYKMLWSKQDRYKKKYGKEISLKDLVC